MPQAGRDARARVFLCCPGHLCRACQSAELGRAWQIRMRRRLFCRRQQVLPSTDAVAAAAAQQRRLWFRHR